MKPPLPLIAFLMLSVASPAVAAPVAMQDLVVRALEQSPSLQAAKAAASAQAEVEGVARSNYLPQVSLNAGLSQTTSVSPAQLSPQPFSLGSTGVTLRQSLWTFGKRSAATQQAEAQTEAAEAQVDLRAVEVAFGVRQAYLNWVQAAGLETQAAEQVKVAETTLNEAQARVKAGVSAQLDVTRAQATLAQARAAMATAKATTAQARRSLSAAIGQTELVAGEPVFPAEPTLASQPISDLSALALEHPTLKTGAAQVEQAAASKRSAQASGNPDLSADASYGIRARDFAGAPNWSAGVSMNWPLFSPAVNSQVRAAEGQVASVKANLESRRLEILRDVDNAYLGLQGAKERVPAAKAALDAARANLAQAQGRYRAGVGSIIEVADAQSLLATAHAEWVRAQTSYHLAIADLQRAMGVTGVSQ
jgi:outer membrane protein TolC